MAFTKNYFKVVRVFPDPSDYFYVKNETLDTISVRMAYINNQPQSNIYISLDKVNWVNTADGYSLNCPVNGKVYFRTSDGFCGSTDGGWCIATTGDYSIGGNIKSLIDYTNMDSTTTIPAGCFSYLCWYSGSDGGACISCDDVNMTGLTTCGAKAFHYTFTGQTLLTKGLDLSGITTVSDSSYLCDNMYSGCSSLVEATTPNITTSVIDYSTFSGWLIGVANEGVVKAPTGLDLMTDDASGVPSGWTVERYN